MVSEFLRIHRGVRRLLQLNRSVGFALPGNLGLAEAHIVIEVSEHENLVAQDLVDRLRLDKPTLSRLVNGLVNRKLVRRGLSAEDQRRRPLAVTSRGLEVLAQVDENANQTLVSLCKGLEQSEIRDIAKLFGAVADGAKIPPASRRPGEHPLRASQRRLTRALGLLSQSRVEDGNVAPSDWYVLSCIGLSARPLPVRLVMERMHLRPGSLGPVVTRLVRRRWISKSEGARSERMLEIEPRGRDALESYEKRMEARMELCLAHVSPSDVHSWRVSFERLVGDVGDGECTLGDTLRARRIESESERRAVRGFACRALAQAGKEEDIPERIVPSDAASIAFYDDDTCVGVMQFSSPRGVLIRRDALPLKVCELAVDRLLDKAGLPSGTDRFAPQQIVL